jgi:hypothetical protein
LWAAFEIIVNVDQAWAKLAPNIKLVPALQPLLFKFHKSVLYLKHNLEKIGRFKISTRGGQQGAQKIMYFDFIRK